MLQLKTLTSPVRSNQAAPMLADLHAARHGSESTSSPSRRSSSDSVVGIYRNKQDARVRGKVAFSSLVELYNRRFEEEQELLENSVSEARPRQQRSVSARSSGSATADNDALSRAASVDASTDEGSSVLTSLSSSEIDEPDNEDDDDFIYKSTKSINRSHGTHRTRSRYIAGAQNTSADVAIVPRSRRRIVRSTAAHFTTDSDDKLDSAGTPAELSDESDASSPVLARPHPLRSKLMVHSSESASDSETESESESAYEETPSGLSVPLITPDDRQGEDVPPLLANTRDEQLSVPDLDHVGGRISAIWPDAKLSAHNLGSSKHMAVLGVSSFDNAGSVSTSSFGNVPRASSRLAEGDPSARSAAESKSGSSDTNELASEVSRSSERERGAERQVTSIGNGDQPSPHSNNPSLAGRDKHSEKDGGQTSDDASEAPILINSRITDVQMTESSAPATDSEGELYRHRYPRRARTVIDYNIQRASERYQRQESDASGIVASPNTCNSTDGSKEKRLTVVTATPQFFEALKSQRPRETAGVAAKSTPSFAEFLMTKARPKSTESSHSKVDAAIVRSAETPPLLTEGQARKLLEPNFGSPLCYNITVSTEDRASFYQLKPSTRRSLGIKGTGPLLLSDDISDKVNTELQPTNGTGKPLGHKLDSILSFNRRDTRPTPAVLGQMFESLDGTGPIGRPRDATSLESASRRLRLGRAFKASLPHTLSTFSDMERHELVWLEDYLPELSRLAREQKAREQGSILIELDSSDWVRTQYDNAGRQTDATLKCCAGGQIKVYFDHKLNQEKQKAVNGTASQLAVDLAQPQLRASGINDNGKRLRSPSVELVSICNKKVSVDGAVKTRKTMVGSTRVRVSNRDGTMQPVANDRQR